MTNDRQYVPGVRRLRQALAFPFYAVALLIESWE